MQPYELEKLIKTIQTTGCEMQHMEIKSAAKGTPSRLYDTLSAFANQEGGGVIIFGMDERKGFQVTGVYDAQDLQVKVGNAALLMEPEVRLFFTVMEYEEKIIVAAEVPECDADRKPCYYRPSGRIRGSYIRMGEADIPMSEYEIYSYDVFRKKIRDELRTVSRADGNDFDHDQLVSYLAALRLKKPRMKSMDEDKALRLSGMTDDKKPTVCGMLLLGEYPQGFFPQLSITCMAVKGTQMGEVDERGARFIDDRRIEGTIPQMLEDAVSFVIRNMKNAVAFNARGQREDIPEYPIAAVREVILNALVHRDYSTYTEDSPIRIIIYSDRMVVENPGGIYGRLSVADLGKMPGDTRNPFLAGGLEVMINAENRFSGIPTIRREMKNAGLPAPVFESARGMFRVTLYNREKKLEMDKDMTAEERIIRYCSEPRTKEEIAEMLEIRTAYYVVSRYLRPMVSDGILKLMIPDRPRSKFQQYYVEE